MSTFCAQCTEPFVTKMPASNEVKDYVKSGGHSLYHIYRVVCLSVPSKKILISLGMEISDY